MRFWKRLRYLLPSTRRASDRDMEEELEALRPAGSLRLPLALAGTRYVKAFLYGITPNDAATITIAVAVLLASGLLAGLVPAARASRIDPLQAIRCE